MGVSPEDRFTQQEAIDIQHAIVKEAYDIVLNKRHDYSGAVDPYGNFRKSEMFNIEPWRGVLVRMSDKISRLQSIMEQGGASLVTDDPFFDIFADMVNYTCILAGLCYEELEWDAPKVDYEPVWKEKADANASEDLGQQRTDRGDDPHAHVSA